jgi:hypothetical protein
MTWARSRRNISMGRLATEFSFILLAGSKCEFGEVKKSNDFILLTTLRNHFLHFGRLQMRPRPGRETRIQGVGRRFELIFCFLQGPKCELDEVEKVIFQWVALACEHSSCVWTVSK